MKNPCRFFRFFEKIRVKKKLMTSFSKVGGYEGFQPLTKIYMFNLSRRFSVLTKSQGLELISSIREACKNKRWFFLFSRDIQNTAPQPLLSSNAQKLAIIFRIPQPSPIKTLNFGVSENNMAKPRPPLSNQPLYRENKT